MRQYLPLTLCLVMDLVLASFLYSGCGQSQQASRLADTDQAAAASAPAIISDGSPESQSNIREFQRLVAEQQHAEATTQEESMSLVLTCIARNSKTRLVYRPFVGAPGVAKMDALTECVVKSVRSHSDACACEIAACSPAELDLPLDIPAAIAQVLDDHAFDIHCHGH